MTEYVLCFVLYHSVVLLISKNKPEWQRGLLNLPGGKIEEGELPREAAARELHEETNLLAFHVYEIGVIAGADWKVHVIGCAVKSIEQLEQKTDEALVWLPIKAAITHPKLIPNLRIIIPMAAHGVNGWTIEDGQPDPFPNFLVTLPITPAA